MKSILTLLFLLLSIANFAQIVNIENKRLSADADGFSGGLGLNVNLSVNTNTLIQIGGKLHVAYNKKRHSILLLGDQNLIKSDDESFINNGFEHLRYNYHIKDSSRFIYEAYQQIQFNKIQEINLRFLLGTGFRFNIIDREKFQLNIGTGLMAEYEELLVGVGTNDLLSANYLSFDGQFSENVGINTITYFQPKITNYGTYRLANETSIRFQISKNLSFRVIYSLTHDSRDREGIRKTNYVLKNALNFTF